MRRLVFNSAAGVSLLLFGVTVTAWFYSYGDELRTFRGKDIETAREIFIFRGRLFYWTYWLSEKVDGANYESESETEPWQFDELGVPQIYHVQPLLKSKWLAGFGCDNYSYPYHRGSLNAVWGNMHERTLWLPLWSLLAAFAILPLIVVRRLWRHFRRPGPGFCSTCRYNLTGISSRVCPECGSSIQQGMISN